MALIDNIVSYWKMDEVSGTRDDSVTTNDLTSVNATGSANGIIALGADMELGSLMSLTITNAAQTGLGFTGSFSASFWMKFESAPDINGSALLGKSISTSNQRGYVFMATPTAVLAFFSPDGTDPAQQQATFATTVSTATWYHVVFSYTSGGSEEITCYFNGASLGTDTTFAQSIFNNTANFTIGQSNLAGSNMDGIIDEVGMWSRALSASEATQLYNNGAGLTYPFISGHNLTLLGVGT